MLTPSVGDRVRLTRANGDEATITVTVVNPHHHVENETNWFSLDSGDGGWEVAEILAPPLPTVPGIYSATDDASQRYLMLAGQGQWHWVDWSYNGSLGEVPIDAVQKYAKTIKLVFK